MKILEGTPFEGQQLEDLDAKWDAESLWFEPKVLRAYLQKTESLRVYSSASIEGNTLTMPEVEEVLRGDVVITGRHIQDTDEVKRLARALRYVDGIILKNSESASPIQERDILDLHALVLGDRGGAYRSVRVRVPGSRFTFPNPLRVAERMERLAEWLPKVRAYPVMGSLVAHTWFVQIHPFIDGNGRTGRALAETILRTCGFPPVVVLASERNEYAGLMEQAWTSLVPLQQFWAQHFETSLKHCEAVREELEPDQEPER